MIGWLGMWPPFWVAPPKRNPDARFLDRDGYLGAFKDEPEDELGFKEDQPASSTVKLRRLERALAQAHDARKFEIEMYWKRAAYFWTFIGAAFVGYAAFFNATSRHAFGALLMSQVGFVFTMAWYLANRGRKFWQENWENQVNLLEDAITGPLYKTTAERPDYWDFLKRKSVEGESETSADHREDIDAKVQRELYETEGKNAERWDDRWTGPRPYSVSKINAVVSLYVMGIWLLLTVVAIAALWSRELHHWLSNVWVLSLVRIAACVVLITPTVAIYQVFFRRYIGTFPGGHESLLSRRTVKPYVPSRPPFREKAP